MNFGCGSPTALIIPTLDEKSSSNIPFTYAQEYKSNIDEMISNSPKTNMYVHPYEFNYIEVFQLYMRANGGGGVMLEWEITSIIIINCGQNIYC